jgi:hypothetical protein
MNHCDHCDREEPLQKVRVTVKSEDGKERWGLNLCGHCRRAMDVNIAIALQSRPPGVHIDDLGLVRQLKYVWDQGADTHVIMNELRGHFGAPQVKP